MTFTFELVTPEKLLFSEEVDMVVVPGAEGDFGVLTGHSQLISTLRVGVIEVHAADQKVKRFCVTGGFSEVTPTRCTVLATESIDLGDVTKEYVDQKLIAANDEHGQLAVFDEMKTTSSLL